MDPPAAKKRALDGAEDAQRVESICVEKFFDAREKEVITLQALLTKAGRNSDNSRKKFCAFQLLPRHLRRRAMSHNPYLVPSPLRGLALKQSRANQPGSAKQVRRRRSRRSKRKASWLETHLWHAKRFKMGRHGKYVIPLKSSSRSRRAAYRDSKSHSVIWDSSFFQLLSVRGTEQNLASLFSSLNVNSEAVLASHKFYHRVAFYRKSTSNSNLWVPIAPVFLHGRRLPSQCLEFWIWVDALALEDVKDAILQNATNIDLSDFVEQWNRYELIGPQSSRILQKILSPVLPESVQLWQKLLSGRPSSAPNNVCLICQVRDPRLLSPSDPPPPSNSGLLSLQELFQHPLWQLHDSAPTWDVDRLALEGLCRLKEHQINARNKTNQDVLSSSCWTVLARLPPENRERVQDAWVLHVPKTWGLVFWKCCVLNGCRPIGYDERLDLMLSSDQLRFPHDYPGTPAHEVYQKNLGEKLNMAWLSKPPAKRVNYAKLSVSSPFTCPWHELAGPAFDGTLSITNTIPSQLYGTNTRKNPLQLVCALLRLPKGGSVITYNARVYDDQDHLLGFVTSGHYSYAWGMATAIAFCRADRIKDLFREKQTTVLVKNASSQFAHSAHITLHPSSTLSS
ncbi:ribonucleases P/MRP protein subunit POP1-like [Schistocerca gregaria]|uniref:ribonucleases P/MRP protein subunit POP1-like n=1 Tax=Schistocerca gregaria TaxID=7010 RepID=UPI00211F1525|nr:ribonucleases P/MRP protein subunit POP1-like [Schistocerca gregaria]